MSDAADAHLPHAVGAGSQAPARITEVRHTRVVALLSDLMVGARLEAASRAAGCELETVVRLDAVTEALAPEPPLAIILDLTDPVFPFPEAYRMVRDAAPNAAIIAFYPHVRGDLGDMARAAGCEQVMPRSRFLTDPASVLRAVTAPGAI